MLPQPASNATCEQEVCHVKIPSTICGAVIGGTCPAAFTKVAQGGLSHSKGSI